MYKSFAKGGSKFTKIWGMGVWEFSDEWYETFCILELDKKMRIK